MSGESQKEGRVRQRLIYHGRVQGVGFRYTTVSIARRFPVAGYVKNLPDGTVEVAVAGPAEAVQMFRDDLEGAFQGNIRGCDTDELDSGEEFQGFEVRYA